MLLEGPVTAAAVAVPTFLAAIRLVIPCVGRDRQVVRLVAAEDAVTSRFDQPASRLNTVVSAVRKAVASALRATGAASVRPSPAESDALDVGPSATGRLRPSFQAAAYTGDGPSAAEEVSTMRPSSSPCDAVVTTFGTPLLPIHVASVAFVVAT